MTPATTQAGMILGTAAYMSPEQAGRPADKRADIWAFGCVLYEMLTGRRAFAGEDVAETWPQVLTNEPDWSALPASTPRRCTSPAPLPFEGSQRSAATPPLTRGLRSRRRSKDEETPLPFQPPALVRHARLPWIVAALATIAAAVAVALWAPWRTAPEPARVTFEMLTAYGGGGTPLADLAISPDGTHVVARRPGRRCPETLGATARTPRGRDARAHRWPVVSVLVA